MQEQFPNFEKEKKKSNPGSEDVRLELLLDGFNLLVSQGLDLLLFHPSLCHVYERS